MAIITPAELLEQLTWRYAVKRFDADRKIDDATWQAIERALVLTPSSYGLQPWRFIVITDEATKAKLPAISWNQKQPQDCSHMVVLAAKETMDADYVDSFMSSVVRTRSLQVDAMSGYRQVLVSTIEKMDSHLDWNARQVYIALGQLMIAAAMLGIDTCPMEGIVASEYDALLGLEDTGYKTVVGCAVGYRHTEDPQATAKKVRFDTDTIITRI
ncbi:MAG: NAD(P)H-dependent oxidoreductase [Pirellulaceae bacterium]